MKLVAVSKTRSVEEILAAYKAGHRFFGENRVQELLSKIDKLPSDIEWHLIGHLQTNKVKQIVPFINMIESVDTFRLLLEIEKEAGKAGKVINCLLQMYIAREETKFGFSLSEIHEMLASEEFRNLKSVRICGLMGMATFTDDRNQVQEEFRYLAECFNTLKTKSFSGDLYFKEISMGMSGDYLVAVAEGSTIIRIGSLIFGERKIN